MNEVIELARITLSQLDARSIIDILVVAAIAYGLLSLIQGTTAIALLRGIALVFLVGSVASSVLGLPVLGWLLRQAFPALLVAIPILFQPEIRRALEQVGRARPLIPWGPATASEKTIDAVATAAKEFAERSWGALLVLEREIPLGEYTSSGARIDGEISPELLLTIFSPHSLLHDGAVIVRGDRVLAAGCMLPLPESLDNSRPASRVEHRNAPRGFGLRHRAGIGISEKTDALSVIVSEETGRISLTNQGRIVSDLDDQRLRRTLQILYKPRMTEPAAPLFRMRARSRSS